MTEEQKYKLWNAISDWRTCQDHDEILQYADKLEELIEEFMSESWHDGFHSS